MVTKFLRFRPLQLCIIAGLCVYILLSVVESIYNQGQKTKVVIPNGPVWIDQNREKKHEEDKGTQNKRTVQEESLKKIESLLEHINHRLEQKEGEKKDKKDKSVGEELSMVRDMINKMFGENKLKELQNRTYIKKGFLEEPINPPPPIPKVELDALPFMKDENFQPSKCPKTLQKTTKYSKWFRERYVPDVKIFFEPNDINLYEKYYKLKHYNLPFGVNGADREKFGDIVNSLNFTKAPFYEKERPKCISCAVVGCGGVLNGSNAGEEIDNHDYVFRLNHAYSSGDFAKDAGSKTSFYTFFPESMHIEDVADNSSSFFFTMFKWYDVDYGITMMKGENPPIFTSRGKKYKLRKPPLENKKLSFIHPDFFRYIFTHYLDSKSHRPTTGALVVFLAIHLCDDVSIYGFGYDPRFTLHYYDKKFVSHTDKSTALHDVDNERDLWKQLHQEGIIRLFKRDD